MKLSAILAATSILLLTGCDVPEVTQKTRLVSDIRALECAVGFAAMDQMRARSRLPDPNMVMGCSFDFDMRDVDITTVIDSPAATTPFGALFIRRLQDHRFPPALVTQISTSPAFAEIENLIARLNAL